MAATKVESLTNPRDSLPNSAAHPQGPRYLSDLLHR